MFIFATNHYYQALLVKLFSKLTLRVRFFNLFTLENRGITGPLLDDSIRGGKGMGADDCDLMDQYNSFFLFNIAQLTGFEKHILMNNFKRQP